MADTVSVTQADREAAADYAGEFFAAMNSPMRGDERLRYLSGEHDGSSVVQAFARHRLASTQPAPAFPRYEAISAAYSAIEDIREAWMREEIEDERALAVAATDAIAALLQGKQQ